MLGSAEDKRLAVGANLERAEDAELDWWVHGPSCRSSRNIAPFPNRRTGCDPFETSLRYARARLGGDVLRSQVLLAGRHRGGGPARRDARGSSDRDGTRS